ncbi:unnamed protein product [Meloidogyne enterolobii]|uniref:Uncharacterized protein n=1 Tax=Meloidogyne enterolobii TaxID=390850 RepID=A0ACB0YMS8_MELEN
MSKFLISFVMFTIVLIQVCDCVREKGTPIRSPRGDHTDNLPKDPKPKNEETKTPKYGTDKAGSSTVNEGTPKRVNLIYFHI